MKVQGCLKIISAYLHILLVLKSCILITNSIKPDPEGAIKPSVNDMKHLLLPQNVISVSWYLG